MSEMRREDPRNTRDPVRGLLSNTPERSSVLTADVQNTEAILTHPPTGHRGCGPVGRFFTSSSPGLFLGVAVKRSDERKTEKAAFPGLVRP